MAFVELHCHSAYSFLDGASHPEELAARAAEFAGRGVVAFGLANDEVLGPPEPFARAFAIAREAGLVAVPHAGELAGPASVRAALDALGARRLGHGVRIVDDVTVDERGAATLGRLAAYVRDCRIPLEMCPSSNIQTGAAESVAAHPITLLKELLFRVTVNTDNRLMSGTSMSREMQLLVDEAGWTLDDLRWATINAMKSAFLPFDERLEIIESVVKPGYAALGAAH